jgi:hypothetical protein
MVSLFEVFYVYFINFRTLNSKIIHKFIHHTQFFLTKLNFYFHERDSREPKLRLLHCALSVVNNLCIK